MASMNDLFTEEELQLMDLLIYQARQHGQSTLTHRGVLPGDSDYQTLLVDAADKWFARPLKPGFSGRDIQLYHNARYTINRFDDEAAVRRHIQRLKSSPSASTMALEMGPWSHDSDSALTEGPSFTSAQRPGTSSISTGVSAQPTTVDLKKDTSISFSAKDVLAQSLPEAGRTQEFGYMPLPPAGLPRSSIALTEARSTTFGQASTTCVGQPARKPSSPVGFGPAAIAESAPATPTRSIQTLDTYLSLYAAAVLEDRVEESKAILRDVESAYSQEDAQWVCVRTYQALKRAVGEMERRIHFLVAEGAAEDGEAVLGPATLQPTEAKASGRTKDPKRKRSAGTTPSEFRGRVPQYPWGSAWSFECLTCDPEFKRRDKAGFNQHMRDVHGHQNFLVVDVHDGLYTWEGIRATRKEDDDIHGEMVFDEAYSLKSPGTGSKPPADADAAYHTANGVDLKVKDRAEETARKKAERKASKQGKIRTGGTRQMLPRGDATSVHHAGTNEQVDEPNEELDGRIVSDEALGRVYSTEEDSPGAK